jgi:hypothetical protein
MGWRFTFGHAWCALRFGGSFHRLLGIPNRRGPWEADDGWLGSEHRHFMGHGGSESAAPYFLPVEKALGILVGAIGECFGGHAECLSQGLADGGEVRRVVAVV